MSRVGRVAKKYQNEQGQWRCSRCEHFKDADEFYKNRRAVNGLSDRCKQCNTDYMREYNTHRLRPVTTESEAISPVVRRGVRSGSTYSILFEQQRGGCALCGAKEAGKRADGRPIRLHIDHCHRTGKIRGLLCGRCNAYLGKLELSLPRLRAALVYLRMHSDT
jgi:Recombination endonuclease VII